MHSKPTTGDSSRNYTLELTRATGLFDGLDELRLLGNDAAHVESKDYDDIGQEEVELAIEFTKEVLKALYQYAALKSRLVALKRKP